MFDTACYTIARCCCISAFVFIPFFLQAQSCYTKADSMEVYKWLNKADDADFEGNLDEAMNHVNTAMVRSKKCRFLRGEGFAWLKMADLQLKKKGADSLAHYYDKALKISERIQDDFLAGLAYFQQGQQLAQAASFPQAEKNYRKAQLNFSKADSIFYTAVTFNELGFINERMGNYDDAVKYNLEAISAYDKIKAEKEAANTKGNLGIIYLRMEKPAEALTLFNESAAIRQKLGDVKGLASIYGNITMLYIPRSVDSAKKYLALQTQYAERSGARLNKAQAYVNSVSLLTREKNYTEAMNFEMKAIALYEEAGDKSKLTARYINAAGICQLLNDSIKAEMYFEKAAALVKTISSKSLLQNLHQQRASFYKDRNNFEKAYQHNTQYYLYRDSIINEKSISNIAVLQTKYDAEKKDNEIARLQTTEKIKQLQIERQAALLNGNKLEAEKKEKEILLLTQAQQLKDESLKRQEEQLTKQTLVAKNNEQQLKLTQQETLLKQKEAEQERMLRQILTGSVLMAAILGIILFSRYRLRQKLKENENLLAIRGAISKDLHDEIGSTLTSINILSNVSQQAIETAPGQAKEMLQQIASQSKTIQQNMSDIVWAIRPDNEKIENLEVRMREYAAQTLEPLNINTHIHFDKQLLNEPLPQHSRKDILLIFKEAVNNIVKHANASEVNVRFVRQNNHAELTIDDNGSWKQAGNSTGTGTKSMEQRALNIGGSLLIEKNSNHTQVKLTLPLP
jgi:two-component system, NarL family, sensor histidine kinase UhpB